MSALKAVEELSRLTLDNARAVGNMSELTAGCGQRVGGRQGRGGHQFGQRHTPVHDHTMEEASQSLNEMRLDIGYGIGYDATGPLPYMLHDDAGPSHGFAHETHLSPHPWSAMIPAHLHSLLHLSYVSPTTPSTTLADVHGRDEMRFMPIPRKPTPGAAPSEFVHTEFIQIEILPSLPLEASHIEEMQGE